MTSVNVVEVRAANPNEPAKRLVLASKKVYFTEQQLQAKWNLAANERHRLQELLKNLPDRGTYAEKALLEAAFAHAESKFEYYRILNKYTGELQTILLDDAAYLKPGDLKLV